MKVLMLTYGSRGDVEPFVALAEALEAAGHEAILGAPFDLASMAPPAGISVIRFPDRTSSLGTDARVREAVGIGIWRLRHKRREWRAMRGLRRITTGIYDDMVAASRDGADVVVHHALFPGHQIAEWLQVPAVAVCPHPVWVPTSSFTYPPLPFALPRSLNRASYRLIDARRWAYQGNLTSWRQRALELPPRPGHHDVLRRPGGGPATVLHPFSRHILPPLDYPDWVHTTGYWFTKLDPEWRPPATLMKFLDAGDPPVYIGFGSMVGADPIRSGDIVAEAVRRAGVRAVVVTGGGGISAADIGENVCTVNGAPFGWLLPRMAAVVHHGGNGTTGAALAAGRPQVVCPFTPDQRFFARRMRAIGVGLRPLPQNRLTATSLARAIRRAVDDGELAGYAARVGRQIRAEGGAAEAADIVVSVARSRARA